MAWEPELEPEESQSGELPSAVSLIGPHLAWRRHALSLQEGLHIAAVLLGCEDSEFDFDCLEQQVSSLLQGLLRGLEACGAQLQRLHVDFDCLDDGAAEGLFGSKGMLKEELQEIQDVQKECVELEKRATGWLRCSSALEHVMGLEALADFLGEAIVLMDRFMACCGNFAARRRAAVARAKAAIETADAEERASAVGLLQEALSPPSRVDFPRITEICQRVADRPDEAEQSAAMLWAALTDETKSDQKGDSEVPRRQLKALTIAHELLYDDRVLAAFTAQDTEPLRGLECSSPGTLGRAAEEAMRMLAAEVRRRVEDARQRSSRRCLTWSFSRGAQGSPLRLRSSKSMPLEASHAQLEALLRRLRRWGSWYRFSGEELPLLESLKTELAALLNGLARLREELCCLDDGSLALPLDEAVQALAPLLLVASEVQARASAWCQALVERSGQQVEAEQLADFLEEALSAEASLQRQLERFRRLRHEAVEKAKAFIEAGAISRENM